LWAGGLVQAIKCLICKHEALSSNPNPTKKIKFKKPICAGCGNGKPIFPALGTWKAEAGGSRVIGQPGLHETLLKKKKKVYLSNRIIACPQGLPMREEKPYL
jgi:hypothetical protein